MSSSRMSKTSRLLAKASDVESSLERALKDIQTLQAIISPPSDEADKEQKSKPVLCVLTEEQKVSSSSAQKKRKVKDENKENIDPRPSSSVQTKKAKKLVEPKIEGEETLIKKKRENTDPTYSCACGKVLSISSRKRHEKTAAHTLYLLSGEKQFTDDSVLDSDVFFKEE